MDTAFPVCGIVAEYNPFHSGHRFHIERTREMLGEHTIIVCAMSGNFVQRGDFAVLDKYARAETAVRGGADLVLGMGLLQKASGISSTWMEYAMHNFLPGMLYTFMSVGLVMLILPSKVDRQALGATLQTKYQELGPVTSEQKRAAILMLVTLILLATDKLHGVAAGLVLIGVTFAAFLPGVRLLDGPKFSKVNFAPLFFIMGCMTIGSAGGFLKVTTWIANNTLPYLHGMTTTTAGLASYVLGALANFLLTPLAATTTMTSPVTELGIQMNMDPRILFYSFQYGLDNYLFPYEYAVILYFFSSGYMLFKDMLKVLAARMVLTGIFLFFLAIPYWKMVL